MSSLNLNNLSIQELKKLVKDKNEEVKRLDQETEKEKLIIAYKKLQNKEEKLIQEKEKIKQKIKSKSKSKSKSKKKVFFDYYQECIKGKGIPKDAPEYFKKALEKAKKEFEKGIILEKSALANFAEKYVIDGEPEVVPEIFLEEKRVLIEQFIKNHRNTKIRMIMICLMEMQKFIKGKIKPEYQHGTFYFQSKTYTNIEETNEYDIAMHVIEEVLEGMYTLQMCGSSWYFKELISLEIHIVEYKSMRGGSYIPLPEFIKKKNAIINIKNEDDKCFIWSVLRYLHPVQKNGERINDLKKYENYHFKGYFPVKVKDIQKFENNNPDLPGINVFSVNDNNKIYPLRINQKDCQKSIDLFLNSEDEKQHYSLIKNFTRLVRSQYTSHGSSKIYICKKCLNHFTKQDLLEKHISYCSKNETVAVKMPTKNTILKFQNHFKKLPIPFAICADFECFTIPVISCQPNPNKSFTQGYQKHEPSGYCLYIKALDRMKVDFKPIVYTKKTSDEDISKKFIKHVVKLTHQIYQNYYKNPKTMIFNSKDQEDFESATKCHICEKKLFRDKVAKKILKVRDHCHFTGEYRGAAHNECNLKCRKPLILPVIFHNLQGYDSHLFIKQLAKVSGDLSTIPSTEEKYISFSKRITVDHYYSKNMGKLLPKKLEIRFIDSFKFLQTSLSKLVENLQSSDFKNLNRIIKNNSSLTTRKGVYPYDYVTSIDKLKETKLPSKEAFYSKLYDEEISDEDYQHANKVWDTFNCQTLQDYHDPYLTTDVLQTFLRISEKTCLNHYKLDPCHYYTAPGLAWDACLKETKQELQLLKDYDMLMMFEEGIRGGISHISKRYAKANNKYMKDFDESQPSTFIQYLDANNLYGWAMTQKLPTHGFKWINVDKTSVLKILEKKDTNQGFIFEVDLDYPKSLWKSHNDYPLAPEKVKIDKVDKLICSFLPKKNYVLHYKNLKQYLEEGMILKKVHRGIKFVQSPWMEPYIRKNTDLRKEAKNAFEKDFFKLMNNSVFGKTIENIRKGQNVN